MHITQRSPFPPFLGTACSSTEHTHAVVLPSPPSPPSVHLHDVFSSHRETRSTLRLTAPHPHPHSTSRLYQAHCSRDLRSGDSVLLRLLYCTQHETVPGLATWEPGPVSSVCIRVPEVPVHPQASTWAVSTRGSREQCWGHCVHHTWSHCSSR